MALIDLTSADAVLAAIQEYDSIGRESFLEKYGFHKARSYFVIHAGRAYDSKAIAGAAHGYQYPNNGPLNASEFSGGNKTVRAQLESLGFHVSVSESSSQSPRSLELFHDYSRLEVHDIFAPETDFTPGAGTWGLAGIVEFQPGEFVLFVTIGREQGDHQFDEGITADGVLTWQSQPSQSLDNQQVRRLIEHDSERRNIRLFLRTKDRSNAGPMPYTYLGRLSYLTHDSQRERPVYFQWQLIEEWPPPDEQLARIGLVLGSATTTSAVEIEEPVQLSVNKILIRVDPPEKVQRRGRRTSEFRGRKSPDYSTRDSKNRALGLAGEHAVIESEIERLREGGRDDLAERVRHVAQLEGDGAGYDVASFDLDGSAIYIEVKTTQGSAETDFFISANEVEFSKKHSGAYRLYRLHNFDAQAGGKYYIKNGSLETDSSIELIPVQYRARVASATSQKL